MGGVLYCLLLVKLNLAGPVLHFSEEVTYEFGVGWAQLQLYREVPSPRSPAMVSIFDQDQTLGVIIFDHPEAEIMNILRQKPL